MTDEDLRSLLEGFRDDINAHVDAAEARTSARFDTLRGDVDALRGDVDALRVRVDEIEEGTRAHMDAVAAAMRRHFDATAERIDSRFDRLTEAVALVDWKIETKTTDLDERMTRGFADLDATIRFSHAHLVHRIERLEA